MKEIPISKFRGELAEHINQVSYAGQRIILERRGKRLAALIPIEEYERLERQRTSTVEEFKAPMEDPWGRFRKRGETIKGFNRKHLQALTPERAIRDVESLLRGPLPGPLAGGETGPLPVSISRLVKWKEHGAR